MWRDKFNLTPEDEDRRKINRKEDPPPEADEEQHFYESLDWEQRDYEVIMYFLVRLKDESKIQVRLPIIVPDYCMSPFTEVLNENNIPYSVIPLEGSEEEGE